MTEQTAANTGQAPGQVLADAGDCGEDNPTRAAILSAKTGMEFIATRRTKDNEPVPQASRGPIPKDASAKQRMARTLKTNPHRRRKPAAR